MNIYKTIIRLVLGIISMTSIGWGYQPHTQECGILPPLLADDNTIDSDLITSDILGIDAQILPAEAVTLALTNLQSYCCQRKFLNPEQFCPSIAPASDTYPQSAIFYDHLIDVGLRRLDGTAVAIYGYDNLVDDQARAWRELITQHGTNPDGVPPATIQNDFRIARQPSTQDNALIPTGVRGGQSNYIACDNLQIYESLTLKTQQQCAIAHCARKRIFSLAQLGGVTDNNAGSQLAYGQCQLLQQARIIDEYATVTKIIHEQANTSSTRANKSYTQEYFVSNRMMTLIEKLTRWQNLHEIVNTKYTEGTRTCN